MSLETPTSTSKLPICFDDMFYQCDVSDANGNISNHTLSVPHYPSGYTITQIAVASIVVTVLMIVIVVGNMLVIIAISTEKALKNIQNWFIASLAVSDFFLGLIIMPFSLANELMGYWVFGLWWCEIHSAMDVLLSTASIMNLCLISLDRYWSITQAVEYLKKRTPVRAIVMIAAVWVLSALICIPPLLGWKVARPKDEQYPKCQGLRKTDDTWLMFGVTMPVQFEEEEEIKKEEQEDIADKTNYDIIDRKQYYEKFMNFQKARTKLKVLNNLLQRKIALYYKKRLKSHVLRESASPSEWLNYVREYMFKLDTYEKLLKKSDQQHSTMELQIENLRIKKEIRRQQLEKMFDNMLNREIHIGIGLIYKKTGKEISDWLINQYISRQKTFMANLSELRAEHIKLKSMVVEKVQAIAKLDKVDNSHNLNRYIKLKEENRIYFDKHEEKEMELIKLREHSMKTLGCLAHIREKCAAVDNDNEDMNNQVCKLEKISMDLRRKVSKSNLEKHKYRSLTTKLKEESGLLLEPNLLKDMERTQKLREELKSLLEDLKKEFEGTNKAIGNIKKIIGTFDASKKSKVQSKHSTTKISQKSIKRKSTPTVFSTVPLDYGFFENCQPIIKKISIS